MDDVELRRADLGRFSVLSLYPLPFLFLFLSPPLSLPMSLLREAEKCLANQSVHSALNAFVSPLHAAGQWRDRVREADLRREQGRRPVNSQSPCPGSPVLMNPQGSPSPPPTAV